MASAGTSTMRTVQVVLRPRPLTEGEKQEDVIWTIKDRQLKLTIPGPSQLEFEPTKFDHLFNPQSTTKEVYDNAVSQLIQNAMNGFNGLVISKGQKGSGKTFTMHGQSGEKGLLHFAGEQIFERVEADQSRQFSIKFEMLEIYNEVVFDLATGKSFRTDGIFPYQLPLVGEDVSNNAQWIKKLEFIQNYRKKATSSASLSSRSHVIIRVTIQSNERIPNATSQNSGQDREGTSILHFVDLAGSETPEELKALLSGKKGAGVERCKEKQSLFTLSKVFKELAEYSVDVRREHQPRQGTSKSSSIATRSHVSFRESKLTLYLQDILSGNASIVVMCHVSLLATCRKDTQLTLKFARDAKTIGLALQKQQRSASTQRPTTSLEVPVALSAQTQTSLTPEVRTIQTRSMSRIPLAAGSSVVPNRGAREQENQLRATERLNLTLETLALREDVKLLPVMKAEIHTLRRQNEEVTRQREQCQTDLTAAQQHGLALERDLEAAEERSRTAETALEKVREELQRQTTDLRASRRRSEEEKKILKDNMLRLKRRLQFAENEAANSTATIENLKSQLADLQETSCDDDDEAGATMGHEEENVNGRGSTQNEQVEEEEMKLDEAEIKMLRIVVKKEAEKMLPFGKTTANVERLANYLLRCKASVWVHHFTAKKWKKTKHARLISAEKFRRNFSKKVVRDEIVKVLETILQEVSLVNIFVNIAETFIAARSEALDTLKYDGYLRENEQNRPVKGMIFYNPANSHSENIDSDEELADGDEAQANSGDAESDGEES